MIPFLVPGPEISEAQLEEMRANLENIDFSLAAQEEKKRR
jgi:hypothetical protein